MAASNTSLIPSPNDLLMVIPRLAQKFGSFAFYNLSEHVDFAYNRVKSRANYIAGTTATNVTTATVTGASAFAQDTAALVAAQGAADTGFFAWMADAFNFEGARGFGGMLTYFGSRWALATFVVVMPEQAVKT